MLDHPVTLASRLGHGSLFSILVPYAASCGALEGASSPVPSAQWGDDPLQGCVVWVVDDDPAIIEGMQALLGSWGCRVWAAATVSALEAASDGERPAVLLVDYHLGSIEKTVLI